MQLGKEAAMIQRFFDYLHMTRSQRLAVKERRSQAAFQRAIQRVGG